MKESSIPKKKNIYQDGENMTDLRLTVEPWYDCPQSCIFCSSREAGLSDQDSLGIDIIKKTIKKHDVASIRWSGGEPLSKSKIAFFVNDIRNAFPNTTQIINTSGQFSFSNLKPTIEKADVIRFSILSDKLIHNYLTNGQNFETAMDNLQKCISRTDTKVELTTPFINDINLDNVLEISIAYDLPAVRVAGLVLGQQALTTTCIDMDVPVDPIGCYMAFKERLGDEKDEILKDACSINPNIPCQKENKMGLMPNGNTYRCAAEKAGYCPKMFQRAKDPSKEFEG